MPIQQVIHISLSIPLYYSIRSLQLINTHQKLDRAFVLLPKKIFKKLPPTSIDIHCKSLVEKNIKIYITLFFECLVEFIANYNTKTCKIHKCAKINCWVYFMFIKILKIIIRNYDYYYLNFFHELEIDLKKFHNFWEDAYLNEKNNIEFFFKKMYNLNIKSKSDDEWDDLQSKLK